MTMYKLSPEQARDLAGKFNAAEGDTAGLIKSMNADVHLMHSMITTLNSGVKSLDAAGHRAMRFDNQWDNEFRPAMQRVAGASRGWRPCPEGVASWSTKSPWWTNAAGPSPWWSKPGPTRRSQRYARRWATYSKRPIDRSTSTGHGFPTNTRCSWSRGRRCPWDDPCRGYEAPAASQRLLWSAGSPPGSAWRYPPTARWCWAGRKTATWCWTTPR